MLALGLEGGLIDRVDADTAVTHWRSYGHPGSDLTSVSVSVDGQFALSAGINSTQWKIWDIHGDQTSECPLEHIDYLLVAKFSPCGRWIAFAGMCGKLWLWDIEHEVERVVCTTAVQLSSIQFSNDGDFLACGGYEPVTFIVDVVRGIVLKSWAAGAGGCFCPTDNNLLVTADRFKLRLWNIETEAKIWEIWSSNNEEQYQNWAIFSPDGQTIATVDMVIRPHDSDEENSDEEQEREEPVHVNVVSTKTGKSKFRLPHTRYEVVRDAAFSDGGDKLVTVEENLGEGGTCRMWDMLNGNLLWEAKNDRAILTVAWGGDRLEAEMRRQARIAFAMGGIPRLGDRSWVLPIDPGVVQMILKYV
jgi:WD40 repeat protein